MWTKAGGLSRRRTVLAVALAGVLGLAGCRSDLEETAELAPLDQSPIFSSSEYGVPVSPRVTNLRRVPKGGGRDQIGKPYQVRGQWYHPREEPGYVANGDASWYGSNFHGRLTANGEVYDMYHLSAAHPTFPLPSYARVTNRTNGRSVVVRVNDRGPYAHGRVMDVSERAAEVLAFRQAGIADVKVEYLGRAPLEGDDGPMLMASFRAGGVDAASDGLPSGVMVASNETRPAAAPVATVAYDGASVLPGVRQSGAAAAIGQGLQSPATFAVPLPTLRENVLSYAPAANRSGAFAALAELTAAGAARSERIELGPVDDVDLLVRIHAVLDGRGRIGGETASLSFDVDPGEDADALLTALWQAGATDAFVLRD